MHKIFLKKERIFDMKDKKRTFRLILITSSLSVVLPISVFALTHSKIFCTSLTKFFSPFATQIPTQDSSSIPKITSPMKEYFSLDINNTNSVKIAIGLAPDEVETPFEITPLPTPSEEILNAIPYPDDIDDHDGVISTYQYGYYTDDNYITLKNKGQVRNCTSISNDELLEISQQLPDFSIEFNSPQPQVLIYHTHTTESFEPYTRDFYDKDFSCKTTDITMNMVAVGNEIQTQLENAGITTLHDTTVHDYPSYNGSYQSSRETVSEILEKYPSIKVVLDVHRDGIEREDGTRIAPVVEIDGRRCAQVMIISCCDNDGNLPNFRENFKLASLFQSQMETDYEGLTRPILFDYRFYNQDLSVGSLLIEIGSHGNSIDEAKNSGELVGKSIANALQKLKE